MISPLQTRADKFSAAASIIDQSGAAAIIDGYYAEDRHAGGRSPQGIRYTMTAVLTIALARIMDCQPPTYAGFLETLIDLDSSQLAGIGMCGQDLTVLRTGVRGAREREYRRFHAWLDRRLVPLDPGFDLPARRVTNDEHRKTKAARGRETRERSALATQRLRTVMNKIVAASITDPRPERCRGDVVADESILDLAKPSAGLGTKPDKHRGAAYCGKYYIRDRNTGEVNPVSGAREISKAGFGIGLTAISRVGPRNALHAVPNVILAIDIHEPTSGSVDALKNALDHLQANGLDTRRTGRARWPYFTIDRGYNVKNDFAALMFDRQYSPVAEYPSNWGTVLACSDPTNRSQPGPIQISGAMYCPAAREFASGTQIPRTRDLLANSAFREHDERLNRLMPFLMGTNSRPFRAQATRGRPKIGTSKEERVKIELVCPAALGRIRCTLKPESFSATPPGTPTATPEWSASDHACCAKSTVTVTLTETQFRQAQWDLVPGSWEHLLYYEAARALTEQRFSLLKSPHVTGIGNVTWGPRREPMIKLILALAVAATNHQIQTTFDPTVNRHESIDIRWRHLTADLGREPVRIPPRT